jgi:t-SNARE complex subunit (syntaxin)
LFFLHLVSQLLNTEERKEEVPSDCSLAIQITTQQKTNGTFNYEESRLDAVHQVQRGVSDLGELMVKFIVLLSEHQELLDRIEVNTVETEKRLVDAESQLLRFLAAIRSNRSLKVKLFLIMFFFIFLFTLLFV